MDHKTRRDEYADVISNQLEALSMFCRREALIRGMLPSLMLLSKSLIQPAGPLLLALALHQLHMACTAAKSFPLVCWGVSALIISPAGPAEHLQASEHPAGCMNSPLNAHCSATLRSLVAPGVGHHLSELLRIWPRHSQ